jgi:hypothetical protein
LADCVHRAEMARQQRLSFLKKKLEQKLAHQKIRTRCTASDAGNEWLVETAAKR